MAKDINNYKCPACGGGIKFDPKTGKVVCEYCDSSFNIEEIEKIYGVTKTDSETEEPAKPSESAQNEGFDAQDSNWNTEDLNSNWGEDSSNMKEYSCPSCGASIICDKTTAATSCPYCDNPTVIEKQFSGSLRPDYVIPFKLKKKEATEALKEFYKGKKLLPSEFSDKNHLEEVKGVYVPFWFFNGTAEGSATFRTTSVSRKVSGNTETITTRYFDCYRAGTLDFKLVPVDASEKMPDDLMDSIEPFDYSELKNFSTAYLPGYFADKFDVSAEKSFERASKRCVKTVLDELRASVKGYNSVQLTDKNIRLKTGKVHYGLVPVYLLYTKWNETRFLFAVNGQTGKVVGNLPCSGKKSFFYFLKNLLISIGIVGALAFAFLKYSGTL